MDGISGTASRARDYSYEELQEMQKDTSTSDIMNQARKDAGLKDKATLRGDDKTAKELAAEHKEGHEGTHAALTTGELAAHLLPEVIEHGAVGAGAAMLAPAVSTLSNLYHIKKAIEQGDERMHAHEKDETRMALHGALDLPKGFKEQEASRCNASTSTRGTRMKVIEELDGKDRKYKAALQMHCDRGQHAALEILKSGAVKPGMTSEMLLKERPHMAAAYKQDAAFRAGFDGILWAKVNSPKEFEASVKSLGERDAAYAKNHIRVQG